MNGSICVL